MARGIDWQRYLPAEERSTALWLAGVLVAVGIAGAVIGSVGETMLGPPHTTPIAIARSVVEQILPVVLVAVLAWRPLRAPLAVVGFLLLSTFVGLAETVIRLGVTAVGDAIVKAGASYASTTPPGPGDVAAPLLGGAASAIALALVALAIAPTGSAGPWDRLRAGCGLAPDSDAVPRRVALAFVIADAAQWALWFVLTRPLAVVDALTYPASTLIAGWLNVIGALVFSGSAGVVLYVALRRYDAPRSLWLAFAVPLATTAGAFALPLVQSSSGAGTVLVIAATVLLFFGALALAEVLGTRPRRRREARPEPDAGHR